MKSSANTSQPAKLINQRIPSIDLLRSIVMVLMALDHTRDFFSNAFFDPLDLAHTTPALFFTRWITHFCAPTFVILAGMGAYLYGARGRPSIEVARYLLIRGFLLIVLEFTLVHFDWFFSFDDHYLLAQVIWMIGWCMLLLAGLIALRMPVWLLTLIGILMIAGHNLLDNIRADPLGSLRWLWIVLHQPGTIEFERGWRMFVLYPLVPWVGVMAVGYGLGPILLKTPEERRRWLLRLGAGMTLAFILIRWINLYGDPQAWMPYQNTMLNLLSFINTTKYPPSLLFLLMTLGPALICLALLDHVLINNFLAHLFSVFGRVPLFYYVIHLSLIHAVAVLISHIRYGDASWLLGTGWMFRRALPPEYGYELPGVYLVWIGVLVLLYPLCRWFARYKESTQMRWISYF